MLGFCSLGANDEADVMMLGALRGGNMLWRGSYRSGQHMLGAQCTATTGVGVKVGLLQWGLREAKETSVTSLLSSWPTCPAVCFGSFPKPPRTKEALHKSRKSSIGGANYPRSCAPCCVARSLGSLAWHILWGPCCVARSLGSLSESGGPFIDQVYVLQGYAEGWKEGTWEEKVDERPCIDPLLYSQDKHEYYR